MRRYIEKVYLGIVVMSIMCLVNNETACLGNDMLLSHDLFFPVDSVYFLTLGMSLLPQNHGVASITITSQMMRYLVLFYANVLYLLQLQTFCTRVFALIPFEFIYP